MRALPNQMSERVIRIGSCPWQARPLKGNCQTFSIPISSSEGCQNPTIGYNAPVVEPPGPSVGIPSNWLRYRLGERSNQRLQARKKLLWSAKPSR
jgi:hypothetical protein